MERERTKKAGKVREGERGVVVEDHRESEKEEKSRGTTRPRQSWRRGRRCAAEDGARPRARARAKAKAKGLEASRTISVSTCAFFNERKKNKREKKRREKGGEKVIRIFWSIC